MTNKYELRVPTTEPYAYINCVMEGTHEEAVEAYHELTKMVHGGFGIEGKEWNKVLDKYLAGGSMSADDGENMSKEQKWLIKEIDKSIARANYTNSKGEIHHSMK